MALDKGNSPEKIAMAVYGYPYPGITWVGSESIERQTWVERFDRLTRHDDERIRQIGLIGKANAEIRLEEARQRERNEAVFGRMRARQRSR